MAPIDLFNRLKAFYSKDEREFPSTGWLQPSPETTSVASQRQGHLTTTRISAAAGN
jgi:hypothetical protein